MSSDVLTFSQINLTPNFSKIEKLILKESAEIEKCALWRILWIAICCTRNGFPLSSECIVDDEGQHYFPDPNLKMSDIRVKENNVSFAKAIVDKLVRVR